jgi:hypothetical protein
MPDIDPTRIWIDETLRLNDRYLLEVVENFGLCPWARATRSEQRLARHVSLQPGDSVSGAVNQLARWAERLDVEIGLLIFPRLTLGSSDFQRFTSNVIEADARRWGIASSPFALAAFHPRARLRLDRADRLIPYLRKSPDPTIQVVRITALERVRGQETTGTHYVDPARMHELAWCEPEPALRERIAARNLRTVQQREAELRATLAAIHRDHDETRSRLPELSDPSGAAE